MKNAKVFTLFFALILINTGSIVWAAATAPAPAESEDLVPRACVLAASAVYCHPDDGSAESNYVALAAMGYSCKYLVGNPYDPSVGPLRKNSVAVFVHPTLQSIIVFAGTNFGFAPDMEANKEQALVDFRDISMCEDYGGDSIFSILSLSEGRAHVGYAKRFHALERATCSDHADDGFLRRLLEEDSRGFIFTGHSMGGGVAKIAALYATNLGRSGNRVITFGTPPIFDAALAGHFDRVFPGASYLRYFDITDGLAHSSPIGNIWGNLEYVHSGTAMPLTTLSTPPDLKRAITLAQVYLGLVEPDLMDLLALPETPGDRLRGSSGMESPRHYAGNLFTFVFGVLPQYMLPLGSHSMDNYQRAILRA